MNNQSLHTGRVNSSSGFTLMELMIVVSLLAIMTAMVTPVFSGTFRSIHAENEIRNLTSFMEYAQNRSITDAMEYRVVLSPDSNSYWVEKAVLLDGAPIGFTKFEDRLAQDRLLTDFVELEVSRARKSREHDMFYIAFYPNGMCDDSEVSIRNLADDMNYVITTEGSRLRWEKDES